MGPPYPTPAEIRFLTERLNLPPDFEWMQDWPVEVSDAARLREFCDLYEEGALKEEVQSAVMYLILCSLDDATPREIGEEGVLATKELEAQTNRIDRWLRQDFDRYTYIIDYWRVGNDPNPEYGFAISPLMRRIWNDCQAMMCEPSPEAKSHWNHRFMRHSEKRSPADEVVIWYGIHEVYYSSNDTKNWTQNPVPARGEDVEDLTEYLELMAQALPHPMLDFDTGDEVKAMPTKNAGT